MIFREIAARLSNMCQIEIISDSLETEITEVHFIDFRQHEFKSNVLYFCNAGKDRTGVVAALLQRQAGMAREDIIADYVRSGDHLKEMFTGFVREHPEINIAVCTPYAEYMDAFLDLLKTHKWEQP